MKKNYLFFALLLTGLFLVQSVKSQENIEMVNLVGDASPAGWNPGNPTPMHQNGDNPLIFEWNGYLKAGELKLSTFIGDWCDGQWINAATADQPISDGTFIFTQGCEGPDNKWRITTEEAGNYAVTINLESSMATFTAIEGGYENLYLLGDATPAGWNPGEPAPMIAAENNPNLFTWTGMLTSGELKISTFIGDWCDGDWLNASEPDQSINNASFIITNNCDGPDNKWRVAEEDAGEYTITVDVLNEIILFDKESGAIYNNLYLVGDASPAGWSIANPTPMVQDANNINLHTWTGTLTAGEFKISTFVGDWCDGDWLLPITADQDLTATVYVTYIGCPPAEEDFKWKIEAEGTYTIEVDLENETIHISSTVSTEILEDQDLLSVFPNPASDKLFINLGGENTATISIYNLNGQLISQMQVNGQLPAIDISNLQRETIFLVHISTPEKVKIEKIFIR